MKFFRRGIMYFVGFRTVISHENDVLPTLAVFVNLLYLKPSRERGRV